jgi:valyl-tRNA synthetase
MKTAFTLEELKKIIKHYDELMGRFQENEYEGQAFYDWLIDVNECDWFLEILKEKDNENSTN